MEFEAEPVRIKAEESDCADINPGSVAPPCIDPAADFCLLNEPIVKLEDIKVKIDEFSIQHECTNDLTGKIKEEIVDFEDISMISFEM